MSVVDIQAAIARLSPSELVRFTEWFEGFSAERWDQATEQDSRAERLDYLVQKGSQE